MTDTERGALCKRIDELCQEVEALKAENAAFTGRSIRAGDEMACLEAENAKLRELLSESLMDYKLYAEKYGLPPYISDVNEHLDARMRELGIEVDA